MKDVYEEHYDAIFQYILFLTTDSELTDDFVQETFFRFFKAQNVRNDKAVLIRIARNLVYDHYRRKRLLKWLPIEQERPDERPLPPEIVERSEEVRRLYRALSEIRLNYREAIVLRYIEEMSVKEVAGHLQMTEAQVKNNTVRGLKALRKILGGETDD